MSSSLLRPLRESDADEVAALFRLAYGDARPIDGDVVRRWLRTESAEDLRVLEVDGRVVGYADLAITDYVSVDIASDGRWDPLLEWAEGRARELGKPLVRAVFPSGHELEGAVAARGYHPTGSSFRMQLELTERPAAALPDGFEVRAYRDEDRDRVIGLLNEAFGHEKFWREVTLSTFETVYLTEPWTDPTLWALAWDGGELAGCVLPDRYRIGDLTVGWIRMLGVREPWRGRGLGGALLQLGFARLWDRGQRQVALGVNVDNPALRIYERAGMRPVARTDDWALEL